MIDEVVFIDLIGVFMIDVIDMRLFWKVLVIVVKYVLCYE